MIKVGAQHTGKRSVAHIMGSSTRNTVIHRKAQVAREEYQARAMSPAKALRMALARSADAAIGLAVTVTAVEQVQLSQGDVAAEFGAPGLLVLLDGQDGARGAMRLDPAFLAALIEVQTTGRVTGRAPADRVLTRTDGAIAAPLIDAMLAEFEEQLCPDDTAHWGAGYRFGAMMEDARALTLSLEATDFHVFRVFAELGEVAVTAAFSLLLPHRVAPACPARASEHGAGARGLTLRQTAMMAPVSLMAVLARVPLPLGRVCGLKVGDSLTLGGGDTPLEVRLEASQKHVVARASLGQMNGMRALRLTLPAPPQGAPPHAPDPAGDARKPRPQPRGAAAMPATPAPPAAAPKPISEGGETIRGDMGIEQDMLQLQRLADQAAT